MPSTDGDCHDVRLAPPPPPPPARQSGPCRAPARRVHSRRRRPLRDLRSQGPQWDHDPRVQERGEGPPDHADGRRPAPPPGRGQTYLTEQREPPAAPPPRPGGG